MVEKNFFVNWYQEHGRHFPWRRPDTTPFQILVTEMLLRQTQAPAVAKIWDQIMLEYPNAKALAQANKEDLFSGLKVLGLGMQRATALQSTASWLIEHYDGQVPDTLHELLSMPNTGLYVAHAVLCFAFGQLSEIVDTNILRFYTRYYDITVKSDIRRNPHVWNWACQALPEIPVDAQLHNYGLLDFTADICKPRVPLCQDCPLNNSCEWSRKNPVRQKKCSHH